jgi:hypothetical protein
MPRTTPGAIAATLDDDVITFGTLDTDANRVANARWYRIRRRPRLWWGDTSSRPPVFGRPRTGRCAKLSPVDEARPVAEYARSRLPLDNRKPGATPNSPRRLNPFLADPVRYRVTALES